MSAYRIQDRKRGVEYLLDPETQYSRPMSDDESLVRHDVSGCETIEELAAYWALEAVYATEPVLVRIEGPQSEGDTLRAHWGEVLVLPETAEVIEDSPVWDLISYLVDCRDEDYTLTYDQLVEIGAECSRKITEKFFPEGLLRHTWCAKLKTSRQQQERFKTMLKFIGYVVAIVAAVAAALGLGVLITWMIFYGLWYVALILMAITGVWLGFKYESKYGHKDEFGDWSEF